MVALATTAYLGLQRYRQPTPDVANHLAADKRYGVTIDLTRYDEATRSATLTDLRQNGLTWLRQPVPWADLEPRSGHVEWEPLDAAFETIARHNESDAPPFKLIAVLQTSPAWARPENSPAMTPPTELADFGRFARAVAERYGHQIDAYQIWHEPNLSANWGNRFVEPAAYADLLREATLNIRAVDPQALILTAALAPTLERGPLNLSDIDYLDHLYQAGAGRWFDIVAAQPYGFDAEPAEPAHPDRLNIRRVELLRQVMRNHGDSQTSIWATAFGWNALPATWAGQPSPWKSDRPPEQAARTAAALEQARRDWPWLGPLLAIRWDTVGLAEDDPARGFALRDSPAVLDAFRNVATASPLATPGRYPATYPGGEYSPGWRFAGERADIPRQPPRTLTIPFEGSQLDLAVQRGPFRGYLWVTIDGQPANALPQDERGQSYLVLYDPLREPATITLARNLEPGRHEAVITAEGGWGQWAIEGWTVHQQPAPPSAPTGLALAGLIAILSGLGLLWSLGPGLPTLGKTVWAWSEIAVSLYAALGDRGHLIVTFALAIAIYLAPGLLALLLLPLLALALLFRPDLGLVLIAFSLSFFQLPKQFPIGAVSPVELLLLLTLLGFIFRGLLNLARRFYTSEEVSAPSFNPSITQSPNLPTSPSPNLQSLLTTYHLPFTTADLAALTFLILGLIATLTAPNFGVSMREWRVVLLEPVIFYFLVRLGADFGSPDLSQPPPWRWAWRLVDGLVAGATLQAALALSLYAFTDQAITAEGVRRALGLAYGSPNNLALFLDRAWPILLVVPLLSPDRVRRWLYGAGWVIVTVALYLTFSKGALLVGLPAALLTMTGLYLWRNRPPSWRRVLLWAGGGLLLLALALLPLSQTARFRTTFDVSPGSTAFFRLKLWQASLTMFREHWPLGLGLDNFLYAYRTRYILPDAWQEPNLSHPHNLILDFGTRLGLGGILVLLWLQLAFWRAAWRLYRASASPLILGLMGSMAIFLSHGLVDNSYFLVDLAFTFFLTLGIVQSLKPDTAF